jgi:hypothetical protein
MSDVDQSMSDNLEPLFVELGKAVFICQSLEESLCFLHAQLSHEEAGRDEGAFEASWDFHSGKALGKLINALRKRIELPEEVDEFLNSGRIIRNEIVHGFMTKNIHRLSHPKGRLEVEAELVSLKLEVKKRDVTVNKMLDALFAKYGFSNADLKRHAGENWVYLNESASGSVQ